MSELACHQCETVNPADNRFCGHCGASLDPAVGTVVRYLDAHLKDRLETAIKERFRDKEVIESELSFAVGNRVFAWAKTLAVIVGVLLAAGGSLLGYLGLNVKHTLDDLEDLPT